jgi:hypothetical protein
MTTQTKDPSAVEEYRALCARADALGQVSEQIHRERRGAVEAVETARVELPELYASADGGQPEAAKVRRAEQKIRDAEALAATRWEDRIEGAMLAARRARDTRDEYLRVNLADLEVETVADAVAARDAVARDADALRASVARWLEDVMGGDAGRIAFYDVRIGSDGESAGVSDFTPPHRAPSAPRPVRGRNSISRSPAGVVMRRAVVGRPRWPRRGWRASGRA